MPLNVMEVPTMFFVTLGPIHQCYMQDAKFHQKHITKHRGVARIFQRGGHRGYSLC